MQVEQLPENVRHPPITVLTQRKLFKVTINRASMPITLCVSCHTASFAYPCSSPPAPVLPCKFRRQITPFLWLFTLGSAHPRSKAQQALQFLPNSKLCTSLLLCMLAVQKQHMHLILLWLFAP